MVSFQGFAPLLKEIVATSWQSSAGCISETTVR